MSLSHFLFVHLLLDAIVAIRLLVLFISQFLVVESHRDCFAFFLEEYIDLGIVEKFHLSDLSKKSDHNRPITLWF